MRQTVLVSATKRNGVIRVRVCVCVYSTNMEFSRASQAESRRQRISQRGRESGKQRSAAGKVVRHLAHSRTHEQTQPSARRSASARARNVAVCGCVAQAIAVKQIRLTFSRTLAFRTAATS